MAHRKPAIQEDELMGKQANVVASLNLDQNEDLFELDLWKADFSKLIKLPDEFKL